MNTQLIQELVNSDYFYIEDENFANITLRVKKPLEVLKLEEKINTLNRDLETEAALIRERLTESIVKRIDDILLALDEVGCFDLLFTKAVFAIQNQCVIPKILSRKSKVYFEGTSLFNITLKNELDKLNIDYQKIDLKISKHVNIITGANMGGKTWILKTIGQIAYMTKLGLPVPAESISVRLFDNVFFSGVMTQEDRTDLSSFGQEIISLIDVLRTQGDNMFLSDEFGRGTNPSEGQALFHAVMNYFLNQKNTLVVATTHYQPMLNKTGYTHFQMKGLNQAFINELKKNNTFHLADKIKIINKYMDYQPIEAGKDSELQKSALQIADMLGLDKEIIEEAKKRL
jgi:dsDNA-specific endonuclease/ATPase MutS2